MDLFAQLLVNGLIAGGTYALAAVGYSMVYGTLKFINFAHGSVAMVGAYIALRLAVSRLAPAAAARRPVFHGSDGAAWACSSSAWPTGRCATRPSWRP